MVYCGANDKLVWAIGTLRASNHDIVSCLFLVFVSWVLYIDLH